LSCDVVGNSIHSTSATTAVAPFHGDKRQRGIQQFLATTVNLDPDDAKRVRVAIGWLQLRVTEERCNISAVVRAARTFWIVPPDEDSGLDDIDLIACLSAEDQILVRIDRIESGLDDTRLRALCHTTIPTKPAPER
jgi:hypothetical protein